jgi:hypothetical protein
MKTIHDGLCTCCPDDADRRMKLSAEWIDGQFYWGVPQPCARGHYPNSIDSDKLKEAHAKALRENAGERHIAQRPPHMQRVDVEHRELVDKIVKLREFNRSATFRALDEDERDRLNEQLVAMHEYACILEARQNAFDKKAVPA